MSARWATSSWSRGREALAGKADSVEVAVDRAAAMETEARDAKVDTATGDREEKGITETGVHAATAEGRVDRAVKADPEAGGLSSQAGPAAEVPARQGIKIFA